MNEDPQSLTAVLVAIARLETKLDLYNEQTTKYQDKNDREIADLWKAIGDLRHEAATAKGEKAGVNWMLHLITSLPAGFVGFFFGQK